MDDSVDTISSSWPFEDPPNVAVITTADILERGEWIRSVFHDEEDGYWQFHSRHGAADDESEARICSLQHIVNQDPSVAELAELPHGWCAWRKGPGAPWECQPQEEELSPRWSACPGGQSAGSPA